MSCHDYSGSFIHISGISFQLTALSTERREDSYLKNVRFRVHIAESDLNGSPGKKLNGCETGDAKITGGYDLPA